MNTAENIDTTEGVQLAYNCDDMVRLWVTRELGITIEGECKAIGAVLDGRLIGGAVYFFFFSPMGKKLIK